MLVKAGWDLAMLTMRQHTPALQWPVGLLYLSVPVSCSAIALVHLGKLLSLRSTTTHE
jgi:TRAP-type transport system small permease protein